MFLVGDIIDAITSSHLSLQSLREVEFELDRMRRPIFRVGGNAVVFRVNYQGRSSALRCYLRKREYLKEIYGARYLPDELSVGDGSKFLDVVVCDWVEGEPLTKVLKRALERALEGNNRDELHALTAAFDRLADGMLSRKDWAHGDLSGGNIIVGDDFEMRLIDNDSNYVDTLSKRESIELGTPAYQSPLRTSTLFNADMDDVSIALISVSLRALALDPSLTKRYPFDDGLLLNGAMILNRQYPLLREIEELFACTGDFIGFRVARMLSRYELHYDALPSLIEFSLRRASGVKCEVTDIELFEVMGVWGYCNMSSGEVAIPPLFDEAFEFRGNEALVRLRRWWYYIDRQGVIIQSCGEWLEGKPPRTRNTNHRVEEELGARSQRAVAENFK